MRIEGSVVSHTGVNIVDVMISFVGTGQFNGVNFSTATGYDGLFSQDVPTSWQGIVNCNVFMPNINFEPRNQSVFNINQNEFISFTAYYESPIGIEEPDFGIYERCQIPTEWADPIDGFYYVNNTDPSASDSGTYRTSFGNYPGCPVKPRLTIPSKVEEGSVVVLAGGPYASLSISKPITIFSQGSQSRPIFYRGLLRFNPVKFGDSDRNKSLRIANGAQYVILENIDFDGSNILVEDKNTIGYKGPHHICIRNCSIHDTAKDKSMSGVAVSSRGTNDPMRSHNLVVYNNSVHHLGDYESLLYFDQDSHGINPGNAYNVWILDNIFSHCSGDSCQIGNTGGNAPMGGTIDDVTFYSENIYFGRNICYNNKQSGFWVKVARNVVASQNVISGMRPIWTSSHCPSSPGVGMGMQYHQDRIYYIYNEIFNCDVGILVGDTAARGVHGGRDVYFVGNLIYNINHTPSIMCEGVEWSPWSNNNVRGYGIAIRRGMKVYTLNNLVHNCEGGLYVEDLDSPDRTMTMEDNVVSKSNITLEVSMVANDDTVARSSVQRNHTFSDISKMRFPKINTFGTLSYFSQLYPVQFEGSEFLPYDIESVKSASMLLFSENDAFRPMKDKIGEIIQ